jgi:uncharacterized protein YdhG (YjbR/CyaY superfamily)
VVAAVEGRPAGYDLSKGTIRFTEAKPIPEDVIREILDLRLAEIGERSRRPSLVSDHPLTEPAVRPRTK